MNRARRFTWSICACACALLLTVSDAAATVVQVDGTIVPVMDGGSDCAGNMQVCLNNSEGVSPPDPTALDAILDAQQLPEIFLPNTASPVSFVDMEEGAGFENSFGYYNVGDDVTNTANLHPIFGCGVPASTHTGEAGGYVQNAEPGATTTIDFAAEQAAGRYDGGFIGFYLITPEGRPSGATNCGDFTGDSYFGRIYYTQRELNNDGNFVHHLVYRSRISTDRFYFGFEDLFRGGDNDFEDMLIRVTGLAPPCVPSVEVCNGRDDDCDGMIDAADPSISDTGGSCTCDGSMMSCEGGPRQGVCQSGSVVCVSGGLLCRSTTGPSAEVCNSLDDNCDGAVDNSTTDSGAACDGPDADLCDEGNVVCSGGVLSCNDATGANTEICNGADDDCDGAVDESVAGVGVACDGADGDLCPEGVTACSGGALVCSDTTPTDVELCNGADDDCDGTSDESPTDVGDACTVGVGTCQRSGATICSGGAVSCNVTPGSGSAERCNALDDDCDGAVDETFMLGSACTAPGACGAGVLECADATSTRCSSAPGGSMSGSMTETCNGIDDDCDGTVDEGLTDLGACGSTVGECSEGRLRCLGAAPTCVGGVGPSPEVCNAADDDCDGTTDETPTDEGDSCGTDVGECSAGTEVCTSGSLVCIGAVGPGTEICNALDDDCDAVSDESPTDVGTACGSTDVGECSLGSTICVSGGPVCAGEVGPTAETCNGADDDCDGTTDETPIDVGRTCGSAMGTCSPGVTICSSGAIVCDGGTVGVAETCNGVDDDCDTVIDEMPSDEGGACGMSEGVCEEGMLRCIAGALQCVGGVLPGTEVCNGLDDDCNGTIDDGELCEGGVCRGGRCSVECIPTEFGFRCPAGDTCVDGYCVEDLCFGVTCEPGDDGSRTVCEEGACVPICDTLSCDSPNVCRRTDGACVGNNCVFLPYLCTDAEICVGGECVVDPCADVSCGENDFCREGDCVGSCAGVACGPTEVCRGGACEPTGCDGPCGGGRVCADGECVDDPCSGVACPSGEVCDPAVGECVDDPCRNITCPGTDRCRLGECYAAGGAPDAGVPGFDGGGPEEVLAAGGTSCAASPGSRTAPGALWVIGLLALVFVRRRRRARAGRPLHSRAGLGTGPRSAAIVAAFITLLTSGCEVDPYCISNCGDGDTPGLDAGPDSATAPVDAAPERPDGCMLGAPEECNEADDDCDGLVDEDIDLESDARHCGACDITCERTGANTECAEGSCRFLACFGGFVDLDEDTDGPFEDTNGCEYRCFESNGGVEACDEIDNDCDGAIDEDYDFDGDEMNCGRCGQVCTFFRVTLAECVSGVCTFDPATDCASGFIDQNGDPTDGCEFECTPTATGVEECNGLDDDCDTRTDEGFDLSTDVTNCGRCGLSCSFPNATASCTTGSCGFDPSTDCDAGFSDNDGIQLNGCEYPCTPTADPTEICDGLDNDCDGRVDGATTDSGGACNEAPGGAATGVCTDTGVVTCVGASLVCVGAPEPTIERCNGADDDCDGSMDESPVDVGRVCAPAVGTCTAGFTACNSGTLDCERAVGPAPEVCNGLDDDCDGTTDEALTDPTLGTACGLSAGECVQGTVTCDAGSLVCAGGVGPALETCNGLDDDCDGTPDDDPVDVGGPCGSSVGACVPGSEVCMSGAIVCSGGAGSGPEVCDGQDDDCDGSTDESLSQVCYTGPSSTRGVGICSDGSQTCTGGAFGTCGGQVLPTVETCDARDEDCDGATDEGVTMACYSGTAGTEGVGRCRAGERTCAGGAFGSCTGEIVPTAESCNSQDDDCDGAVDEATGGGALTQTCYSGASGTAGVGTCAAGVQTCRFGAFDVCAGEVVPVIDRCGDALDTDCDGLDDTGEGCLTAGTDLRIDTGTAAGSSHSYDVRVAAGGSPRGRNLYAVWVDKRNGTSTADIWFSRSTDGGATWSSPTDLTTAHSDRAVRPEIVVGRSGSNDVVHVVYQIVPVSGSASTRVRQIWAQRSTNGGGSFSSPTRLDTTSSTDNFKHSVATSADGARVVVAWEQLRTDTLGRRVLSRASTNSGSSWAGERMVSVNIGATPTAGEPVVAVTASGRFVFAWREARPPAQPTFDVYATYSDDASSAFPSGRERRLDGDSGQTRVSDDLRIASDGERIYLVWTDTPASTGGGADIVFSRSADGGASWSAERVIDDPAVAQSDSSDATIAVDPRTSSTTDDRVLLAWVDTRNGTQIFFARSDDSGVTFGAPVRASQAMSGPVPGVNDQPRIAHGGGGAVIIAYVNDANGSATNRRVRAAVSIDGGSNWQIDDPVLDSGGGEAVDPAIAPAEGSGLTVGAAVAWIDFRSGSRVNGDVYRARVGR